MATFPTRLKELRVKKGLTQDKLAEHFYITKSAISKYENGVNTPEYNLLKDIANFFDVSIDYLLGRTNILKETTDLSDKDKIANDLKSKDYLENLTHDEKILKAKEFIRFFYPNDYEDNEDDEDFLINNILGMIELTIQKNSKK